VKKKNVSSGKKRFVRCMTWRLRHIFPCIQRDNTQTAYSRPTKSPHKHTRSPQHFWELVTNCANLVPTQTYCCKGNHAAQPEIIQLLKYAPYWEIFRTKPSTSAITKFKAQHHWSARPAVLIVQLRLPAKYGTILILYAPKLSSLAVF